jgi:hypothetical protein
MMPRQKAGHMIAVDTPVKILRLALASKGPSTHERLFGLGLDGRARRLWD